MTVNMCASELAQTYAQSPGIIICGIDAVQCQTVVLCTNRQHVVLKTSELCETIPRISLYWIYGLYCGF